MSWLQSVFLGLIQGLTEFLPVSSSGHLAIFKNIFHLQADVDLTFDILLHVGTLIAVFIVYWKDICQLIVEACKMIGDLFHNLGCALKKDKDSMRKIVSTAYRKFVVLVLVSTVPTGIIGFAGKGIVEAAGKSMLCIGIFLLITSVMLFLTDRFPMGTKRAKQVSYPNALLIGVAQGFATLPGISRSGTTIFACSASGFDRGFAVKYSFIMSIPAILGAAILDVKDLIEAPPAASDLGKYFVGMIVSAVVGLLCIKFVTVLVKNRKFKYFGFYCVAAGLLCIIWSIVS